MILKSKEAISELVNMAIIKQEKEEGLTPKK